MKILLVEDHRLVAEAMQMMLQAVEPGLQITPCYSTQHALSIIDDGQRFDLVATDLFMPGIDGIGLLQGLKSRCVPTPVVIISGSEDRQHIHAALEHGASGYIPKTLPSAEMLNGLRQVLRGERFFPDSLLPDTPYQPTSYPKDSRNQCGSGINSNAQGPGKKQLQVLQLMADGHSNKQISQIIGISEATVKYHSSQLFKLLSVRNRTSCVREARQRGLISSYAEKASQPTADEQ